MSLDEKILNKLHLEKFPMRFKIFIAKVFIRCFEIGHLDNDIILYNELDLWIKTKGRPTTSNPNYWINKKIK